MHIIQTFKRVQKLASREKWGAVKLKRKPLQLGKLWPLKVLELREDTPKRKMH